MHQESADPIIPIKRVFMLITWLESPKCLHLAARSKWQTAQLGDGWLGKVLQQPCREAQQNFFKLKLNVYYEGEPRRLMLISPFHHSQHLSHNSPAWF